ncbi:MAG: Acetyltransferase YpeA, partial [Pseudomonadota bacterium]
MLPVCIAYLNRSTKKRKIVATLQVQVVARSINAELKIMPTIRQYTDPTDRIQVVELWRQVFGYETAHNEPNLAISKKIAI